MKETKQSKKISPNVTKTSQSFQENVASSADPTLMIAQINRKLQELLAAPKPAAGLYLIATPIGNLSDISLRALTTLFKVDAIYCEDTRHSRKLLSHYSIKQSLHPYHDHNAKAEGPKIVARIERGESIALISDAGTPLISDPGYDLVKIAHQNNIPVTSLPGPSAVITALSMAGMPTDTFTFEGFLPPKSQARLTKLKSLESVSSTLVFYESPKRIHKTLHDMNGIFPDRYCVLAKELSKLHETLHQGSIQDLIKHIDLIIPKGEYVILLAPAPLASNIITDAFILKEIARYQQTLSLRDAIQKVSKDHNISKKIVYALGLTLKNNS